MNCCLYIQYNIDKLIEQAFLGFEMNGNYFFCAEYFDFLLTPRLPNKF